MNKNTSLKFNVCFFLNLKCFALLFFISLFFTSCKEGQLVPFFLEDFKINNFENTWTSFILPCPTGNEIDRVCIEPPCRSYNSADCQNRRDLDPCNYSDLEDFVYDFTCEITKLINGSTQRNFEQGCYRNDVCYELNLVHPDMLNIFPDGSPYRYCSSATCGTYYCPNEPFPYRHFTISIAYQNALMNHLRNYIATLVEPNCPENYEARLGDIYLYYCKFHNQSNCENLSEENCHDIKIGVRFEFWCCPNWIQ